MGVMGMVGEWLILEGVMDDWPIVELLLTLWLILIEVRGLLCLHGCVLRVGEV